MVEDCRMHWQSPDYHERLRPANGIELVKAYVRGINLNNVLAAGD
jgi:hypothetical protein